MTETVAWLSSTKRRMSLVRGTNSSGKRNYAYNQSDHARTIGMIDRSLALIARSVVSQRIANYFSKLMLFIMIADRSIECNVHLYDVEDRETVLDNLILINDVIKFNFYSMMRILLLFQFFFSIEHEISATLERNEELLSFENYYVVDKSLNLILMRSVDW